MADNQKNVVEIVVDDGSVKVPIRNKQGDEIGVFYFHPTDVGIVDRYNQMVDKFDEITAPLEHISIAPDGTSAQDNTAEQAAALSEAEKRLSEAVDFMFGGNMSEAFFGKMHPFSPINGRFYCENAIYAVGQYISKQFDREVKVAGQRSKGSVERMDRYTHGYKTGKHKGGKK